MKFKRNEVYCGDNCSVQDERPCDLTITNIRGNYLYGFITRWAYGEILTQVDKVKAEVKEWDNGVEFVCIEMDDGDWLITSEDRMQRMGRRIKPSEILQLN